MPSYRVDFLNHFPKNEKLFKVCQRSIVVRSAKSPQDAIETAKQRFATLEGIRDWRIHAAMIEVFEESPGIAAEDAPATPFSIAISIKRGRAGSSKRKV